MIYYIKRGYCTISLCLMLSLTVVQAADEDIDIPYTDTYGYVYDPATGSFIKQDQPTADTGENPDSPMAAESVPAATPEQTPVVMAAVEADSSPAAEAGTGLPAWLILPLLVLAAFTLYRLIPRKNPAHGQNTH